MSTLADFEPFFDRTIQTLFGELDERPWSIYLTTLERYGFSCPARR